MEISDIKAPFASQGDRETFDYEQTSNELSWLGGYTYLYGLKPEETDKNPYILREKFNEIMYLMSGKMLQNEAKLNDLDNKSKQQGNDLANLQGSLGKNFVTLDTQQNITALKTFDKPPQTQTNPVGQDDLVRLGYLSSGAGGLYVNGTWHERKVKQGVTYTNTRGKPIFLLFPNYALRSNYSYREWKFDNITMVSFNDGGWATRVIGLMLIKPNGTYKLALYEGEVSVYEFY